MTASRSRLSVLCATVGITLMIVFMPGVAFAGSPNDTQYGNPSATEPTTQGQPSGVAGASEEGQPPSGGALPFTGQQLALFAGLGGLFIIAGLGLRVVARARNKS